MLSKTARLTPLAMPATSASASRSDIDVSAVKTLKKALGLLQFIAASDRPITVAAVALGAGVSRPTAHRLCQTLVTEGFLSQDEVSGRLSIGYGVLPLAASHLDNNRLRLESLPHLNTLAQLTKQRVNLGVLFRKEILYLAGIEKPSLPMIYSRFGKTAPAHCCSMGKAILANLPKEDVNDVFSSKPIQETSNSITDFATFEKELSTIRKQGYAIDHEEHLMRTFCVGFAIFNGHGEIVGAISVSGPNLDVILENLENIRYTAELISHLL